MGEPKKFEPVDDISRGMGYGPTAKPRNTAPGSRTRKGRWLRPGPVYRQDGTRPTLPGTTTMVKTLGSRLGVLTSVLLIA